MKHRFFMVFVLLPVLAAAFSGCSRDSIYLRKALKYAGENRHELETVLRHYRTVDDDPEKLDAAKYLIGNMPVHYSYSSGEIENFYDEALEIMHSGVSAEQQRDSINRLFADKYPHLAGSLVSDVRIIGADYLIYSIDQAFDQWRNRPWAQHLSFEEFRDWILPYKAVDLQSLDYWRDTLSARFSDSISTVPSDDLKRTGIYGAIDIVRNEIHTKNSPTVFWGSDGGPALLGARTLADMTYGTCLDYVTMGTLTFRSMGLPAVVDQVPCWGRNHEGHSWFTFLSDQGREVPTINSLIMPAGIGFYPYERIPKVFRTGYTVNRERMVYLNTAKYVYPFKLCDTDVTDHYCRTSDLEIPIRRDVRLKDRYVYIAMAVNADGPEWRVLDYGRLHAGKACFRKMGRNMLYIVLGFDGNGLLPVSDPFFVEKNGSVEYIHGCGDLPNKAGTAHVRLFRKYYESANVVDMRGRLHGGRVQYADDSAFTNVVTVYEIDSVRIPDRIPLPDAGRHRYWRYLSPLGSWGSISELDFLDNNGNSMPGRGIANAEAGRDAIDRAYDGDRLSNFEINQPDGNWIGRDFNDPESVSHVRIVPRSDDNDICPGLEYELFYWNGLDWRSLGYRPATEAWLDYDDVPLNTLLWLRCYSRGRNERPFMINDDMETEWF